MAFEPPVEAMSHAVYASWGRRFVAWLLDSILVWGPVGAASVALPLAIGDESGLSGVVVFVPLAFLAPLYWAFFHASERGQTLGKRALAIAVRNEKTLGRISLGRALGRAYVIWAFLYLAYIPWILDSLWPLWDVKHQTWHDKVAASVVVRV